jgi:hypothetical protein
VARLTQLGVQLSLTPVTYSDSDFSDLQPPWMSRLTAEDLVALGQSLRQIDPKWAHSANPAAEERVWYQGQEPYFDVMVERRGEGINWLQFTLRGRVLSWQASSNRIITGETEELDTPPLVTYYAASKGIRSETGFDAAFVKLAIAILRSRPEDGLLTSAADLLAQALPSS